MGKEGEKRQEEEYFDKTIKSRGGELKERVEDILERVGGTLK